MPDFSSGLRLDLSTLTRGYQSRVLSPRMVVDAILKRLDAADPAVWIHRSSPESLRAQVQALEQRQRRDESLPLFGAPFAVKDNIDVAGLPTTAACPAFAYVAQRTAPVVERLQEAGAILIGKTNLDQFACGLAGDRSPYGACRNPFHPEYISGGSSSGSAVAVATGLVSFALGTDTAGSGRVPAGCANTVGLKPTPGLLSTEGVVPACRSLDCVSIHALTVEDAQAVLEVARKGTPQVRWLPRAVGLPLAGASIRTFAVPRDEDLEFCGDRQQAQLFRQSLDRLEGLGWRAVQIDFGPFWETGSLLYDGPWVVERWAAIADFVTAHPEAVLPVIRDILEGGKAYSAIDVFQGMEQLRKLGAQCLEVFQHVEVLVVPTFPTLPRLAQVQDDSRGWSRRLGCYTNFVNLLGLAAVALPAGFTGDGLPGGITVIGPGGSDRRLCELGKVWQRNLKVPLGAVGVPPSGGEDRKPPEGGTPTAEGYVRVAVAGAHLRGQPLHVALCRMGAQLVRTAQTAARYRFLALMHLDPPRPGLLRDDERAGSIEVEIYDLPLTGFGMLVESVLPPLAIGTVELADGEQVKGFLCESFAAARARDITDFGGWLAFRNRAGKEGP